MLDLLDRRRGHSLMPDELREKIPALYSQEGNPDPLVQVKFFCPYSQAVWFVTEFDGEDTMFGWCDVGWADCAELGYISLLELSEASKGSLPLVERDLYWKPVPLSRAKAEHGRQ